MAGYGAIPGSLKSRNFADRTVRNVRSEHKAASSTATMLRAAASPERCAAEGPTPFSDLLTTMIEAHAAEGGRTLQNAGATGRIDAIPAGIADARASRWTHANAAPPAASRRWRAQQLNVCVVGLIVAIGGVIYVPEAGNRASEAGKEQPPAIAVDEALQARSVVIANANANDQPMERPLQAGESGGARRIGVGEEPVDEAGMGTKSTSGAHSNDGAVATPVVG